MATIDRRRLFLETVSDLRRRVQSGHAYQVLGISALLRKLLLDEAPLVDLVNRDYKLKIRFRILVPRGPPPNLPPPVFWATGAALDPDSGFPHGSRRELTKSQFLSTPIVLVRGHKIAVHDLIHYYAHVVGAVHAQEPKFQKEKALVEIERWIASVIEMKGLDFLDQQLCVVGAVVLAALTDIETAVITDTGASDSGA